MIAAWFLAALPLGNWPNYSSQAEHSIRWGLATPAPDRSRLRALGSDGVPSWSGEPKIGSCFDADDLMRPVAREVARDRAQALAAELGLTLGKLWDSIDSHAGDPNYPNDTSGCGLPKFGRAPWSTTSTETYLLTGSIHVGAPAQPGALPTPLYRAWPASPAPQGPGQYPLIMSVGSADRIANHDRIKIDIRPPNFATGATTDGPQSVADIASIFDAVRKAIPRATVDEQFLRGGGPAPGGQHAMAWTFAELTVDFDAPLPGEATSLLASAKDAAGTNFDVQMTTDAHLDRCAEVEDAARLDAIERLKFDLSQRGYANRALPVLFAEQSDTSFERGTCGPVLDSSFLDTDVIEPVVRAYVTLKLRFRT